MSIVMTGDDHLAYQAVCESCKTSGPRVEWSLSKGWPAEAHAVVAAEARLIGWVEVKPARDGGHFPTWLCKRCAGGLL